MSIKYFNETLVTDVIAWEVVASTAKTITIRKMMEGDEVLRSDQERTTRVAVSNPTGFEKTIRLRKDGTYRTGPGARPLCPTDSPVFSRYWLD